MNPFQQPNFGSPLGQNPMQQPNYQQGYSQAQAPRGWTTPGSYMDWEKSQKKQIYRIAEIISTLKPGDKITGTNGFEDESFTFDGNLFIHDVTEESLSFSMDFLQEHWLVTPKEEKVKVTWQEAIEAYNNGKEITCSFQNDPIGGWVSKEKDIDIRLTIKQILDVDWYVKG